MKPCPKCPDLKATWLKANQERTIALSQYGVLSREAVLAEKAEMKARRKLVAHSVGCGMAAELTRLISSERRRKTYTQSRTAR
jgi:hypothetical protein